MKRSGPPKRKTPLKAKKGISRGTSQLARTGISGSRKRIAPRAAKTAEVYAGPRGDLNGYLAGRWVRCQVGAAVRAGGDRAGWCGGRASCWHELRKRSAGGSILNPENLVAACGQCNGWVEDEPESARRVGMVVLEDDPRWEQLGERWWRNHMKADADATITARDIYVGQAVADTEHGGHRAPLVRVVGVEGQVIDLVLTPTLAYLVSAQLVSAQAGMEPLDVHLERAHNEHLDDGLRCDQAEMARRHLALHPGAIRRA